MINLIAQSVLIFPKEGSYIKLNHLTRHVGECTCTHTSARQSCTEIDRGGDDGYDGGKAIVESIGNVATSAGSVDRVNQNT